MKKLTIFSTFALMGLTAIGATVQPGGSTSSSAAIPSYLYVDTTNGIDATGARGSIAHPFKTITKAITAGTTAGDTVFVYPGMYAETGLTNKANMVFYFSRGAILTNAAATITWNSLVNPLIIRGNGTFTNAGAAAWYSTATVGTYVDIECNSIQSAHQILDQFRGPSRIRAKTLQAVSGYYMFEHPGSAEILSIYDAEIFGTTITDLGQVALVNCAWTNNTDSLAFSGTVLMYGGRFSSTWVEGGGASYGSIGFFGTTIDVSGSVPPANIKVNGWYAVGLLGGLGNSAGQTNSVFKLNDAALAGTTTISGAATVGTLTASGVISGNASGLTNFTAGNLGTGSSITTKFLRGDLSWQAIPGGGDALVANPLSQFAAGAAPSFITGNTKMSALFLTNGISSTNSANDSYTEAFGYLAGVPGGPGGIFSTFAGYQAGYGATNVQFSDVFGYTAGASANNMYATTAYGYQSMNGAPRSVSSVAIGYGAGQGANDLQTSELIGVHVATSSTNLIDVHAIGYHAAEASPGISYTIAIGDRAALNITNVLGNIFLGDYQAINASYKLSIDGMGGFDSTHRNAGALIGGDFNARTFDIRGTITATNAIYGLSVTATNQITASNFRVPTNLFSGTLFVAGTNGAHSTLSCSTNLNFTGVTAAIGADYIYGELTVKATGTLTVTNPIAWYCNDGLTNRTVTNGNLAEMSMKVVPGFSTNFIFTQHWHP